MITRLTETCHSLVDKAGEESKRLQDRFSKGQKQQIKKLADSKEQSDTKLEELQQQIGADRQLNQQEDADLAESKQELLIDLSKRKPERELAELKQQHNDLNQENDNLVHFLNANRRIFLDMVGKMEEMHGALFAAPLEKAVTGLHLRSVEQDNAELTNSTPEKDAEINALRFENNDLRCKVAEKNAKIGLIFKQKNAELACKDTEIMYFLQANDNLRRMVKQKDAEIARLERPKDAKIGDVQQPNDNLRRKVDEKDAELTRSEHQKDARCGEIHCLLKQKNDRLGELLRLLKQKDDRLGELQRLLKQKDDRLGDLCRIIKQKDAELARKERQNDQLVQNKDADIAKLKQQIGELQQKDVEPSCSKSQSVAKRPKYAHLKQQYDHLKQQYDHLKQQNDHLKQRYDDFRSQVGHRVQELEAAMVEVHNKWKCFPLLEPLLDDMRKSRWPTGSKKSSSGLPVSSNKRTSTSSK